MYISYMYLIPPFLVLYDCGGARVPRDGMGMPEDCWSAAGEPWCEHAGTRDAGGTVHMSMGVSDHPNTAPCQSRSNSEPRGQVISIGID